MFAVHPESARAFAAEWIAAWNAHDLDRILAHYADDVEFASPYVMQIAGESSGRLSGKQALRDYWEKGLAMLPGLRFTLVDTLVGIGTVTLVYRGHRGAVAETFTFNNAGRVRTSTACYSIED